MVCIYCGRPTKVINSRKTVRANQTWRRRQCTNCQALFTTTETVELATTLVVQQRDGSLVPFSSEKLLISLHESLKHRANSAEDASALCKTVTAKLLQAQHGESQPGLVPYASIRSHALRVLQRFDNAAATHYAAYHPEQR